MNVVELPWKKIPSQWAISFNVEEPERVVSKVEAPGGKVLVDFDDDYSDGSVAVLEDPMGAVFLINPQTEMIRK